MEVAAAARQKAAVVKAALLKTATAAKDLHAKRVAAGTFQYQPAKTAQEAALRRSIQSHVREILGSR
jgi:hypothetical protein